MARQYAQVAHAIWNDDDWLDLSPGAQHLYLMLLSHPTLSYAGVMDWRPGRLMQRAKGWTPDTFFPAAFELSDAHYIVVDTSSEEVLIRTFLRHDSVLTQPRLAVSVTKAFGAISSRKIRGVVVWELNRLQLDRPSLKCWEDDRMLGLLGQEAVDSRTLDTDFDVVPGDALGVHLAQTLGNVSGSPTTSTSTSTSNKQHWAEHFRGGVAVEEPW